MRQFKFRAWEKTSESMVYDVQNVSRKRIIGESACESFQEVVDSWEYEIMQYTGLKDKNGKEIYEGDIVKLVSTEWADDDPIIDVVEWGLGDRSYPAFDLKKFSYETEMNSFSYIFNSGYYEIEVIGNIYENPELLKEESK